MLLSLMLAAGLSATHAESTIFTGHTREANVIACSADGKRIASGGEDTAFILWDAATHASLSSAKGEAVTAVAFSPDGNRIASGERYKKVKLFDNTGKELKALDGHDASILALGFTPDSKTLYSFALDGGIRAWDATSGAPQGVAQKMLDSYTSAAFSSDGKFALGGTSGGSLNLFSLTSKKQVYRKPLGSPIRAVAISPDGKLFAVALGGETVRLLDTTGNEQGKIPSVEANGLAFSADGKRLAAAGHDNDVHVISIESKSVTARLKGHDRSVRAVCFTPEGLVSASFDKTLRLWTAN